MDAMQVHVTAEALAVFLEGGGTPEERRRIEHHLAGCDECYELFVTSARLLDDLPPVVEGMPAPPPAPRSSPFPAPASAGTRVRWNRAAAGALAAAAAVLLIVSVHRWRDDGSDGRLAEAYALLMSAVEGSRPAEGRLAGWTSYGPPPPVFRSTAAAPLSPRAEAAVARVQEAASPEATTPEALRALAASCLVSGDYNRAVALLERAAADAPDEAAVQIDLAAVYLERARRAPDPHADAEAARQAAERAVAVDPRSVEARFNLALALDRLGDGSASQQAWREYLELDGDSNWAAEARQRASAAPAAR